MKRKYMPVHKVINLTIYHKLKNNLAICGLFLVMTSLILLSGCNKTLDTLPDNRAELSSPDKVSQLLITAYPDRDYITFCESMSDNMADRGYATTYNDPLTNDNPFRYLDYASTSEGSSDEYWLSCYRAIAAANQALQACNKAANPADYSAQKGEALVARAYAHFMLVTLFAKTYDPATAASDPGVPYVLEPENTLYKKYERKTVAYVYDMIDKDLSAGIPLINDNAYKQPAYRFNIAAAQTFASRFYLFYQKYDKVIEHAGQALPANFVPYLRAWNTTYSSISSAEIGALYTKSTEKANLLLTTTAAIWGFGWQTFRYGLNANLQKQIYSTPNVTGGAWADKAGSYGTSGQMMGIQKWHMNFVYITTKIGNYYMYIPLVTAEEAVFNKAEAYVMQGNFANAITLLNTYLSTRITGYDASKHNLSIDKVNTFYKTSDTKQALINTILDFKRVEYMQEGMRWFDILRYHIPVVHIDENKKEFDLTANDLRRVLQIPQTAQTSGGLAANPR